MNTLLINSYWMRTAQQNLLTDITMLKAFHVIAVLSATSILFIAPSALTRPITISNNKYPAVSTSDVDKPVCYMQTLDHRTLDLSRLCEKKASNQIQLTISDVTREDDFLSGNVVNQSNKTVYQARINYEVIGENNSVIERGAIVAQPTTLTPGQMGIFQTVIPGNRNVRTIFAEGKDKE